MAKLKAVSPVKKVNWLRFNPSTSSQPAIALQKLQAAPVRRMQNQGDVHAQCQGRVERRVEIRRQCDEFSAEGDIDRNRPVDFWSGAGLFATIHGGVWVKAAATK
jgi:hypothetical protein